jgi:AmmeMemoRadiSam system protein B
VIRQPVAAGSFYPEDRAALATTVDELLARAVRREVPGLHALVAPHAGYQYSGAVAASAFALAPKDARVVLLGPSHFVPLAGLAVSGADAWSTPLGDVSVSSRLRKKALAAGAFVDDGPHARDHALEVELPFLQRACTRRLEILPVAVGSCVTIDVVELLDALDAFAIVSTDLSHHLSEEFARERDLETANAILRHETHAIRDGDACGVFALRGVVEYARERELPIELLDLRTSADATGDRETVVGYGAFAISSTSPSG